MISKDPANGPRICIATPQLGQYSETFIRSHIQSLPGQISVLYGGPPPRYCEGKRLVSALNWLQLCTSCLNSLFLYRSLAGLDEDAVKKYIRTNNIQLILAEYGTMAVSMIKVCNDLKIPLIAHFHGVDAYDTVILKGPGARYGELFECAAGIIAVSRHMEDQLLNLGAPREKLVYIPYGVDTELFRENDVAINPPLFLAVGRFVEKKAPHLTLWAFKQVLEAVPEARLVFIGDGPLLEPCRQLSHCWEIAHAVDFRGACAHEEVVLAMSVARGFVQHSIRAASGDCEGTPVAVLEAGASGLPVIATQHAGISDVVQSGTTGFLVDEYDTEAMARFMIMIAKEPALARLLGKAARERICANFNDKKSIKALYDVMARFI